jgi:hypothetical protein
MLAKNSDAHVLLCEQGAKSFLVEAMECVWSFEGNQEVPKTWFLGCSIQQMVAQGNILVPGKTSNFLECFSIFLYVVHFLLVLTAFDFCSLKLKHSSCTLPQSLTSSS